MGVNLKDLIISHPVSLRDLAGKTLAVDSFNLLYQFITTIRGSDGTPLQDRNGRITSHLQGLFSRTASLMEGGIRLVFVFDGEPPALKHQELARRSEVKQEAQAAYEQAKAVGDVEGMHKYAGRTARLSPEMVEEAKVLVQALGQPVVQAPSEGEAQVSSMVRMRQVFAGVSQDYDALLYAAPRLVRNVSIQQRHRLPGRPGFRVVGPELVDLEENLRAWGISSQQLLWLAILVGTDYNPGGIRGIGPKKALELVKKYASPSALFEAVDFDRHCSVGWREVLETFESMPVVKHPSIAWRDIDADALRRLLVDAHDFSAPRVEATLASLEGYCRGRKQQSLGDF